MHSIPRARRHWRIALAAAILFSCRIVAGWQAGHHSAAAVRFTERRLTGNPENDPVTSASISPDGKYLAFADRTGFFLRVVATGETHPVPIPGQMRTYPAEKDPGPFAVSWFPDGSHVLQRACITWGETQPVERFGLRWLARKLMDAAALGAVSPDGTQIVFVRGDFAHQEIWQMQSDGGQARKNLRPARGQL